MAKHALETIQLVVWKFLRDELAGSIARIITFELGKRFAQRRRQFYEGGVLLRGVIVLTKFATLHHWLTENIYRHGRKFEPADLVERSTGGTMSTAPYLHYLTRKYGALNDSR